jgi:hypothetical protein
MLYKRNNKEMENIGKIKILIFIARQFQSVGIFSFFTKTDML